MITWKHRVSYDYGGAVCWTNAAATAAAAAATTLTEQSNIHIALEE